MNDTINSITSNQLPDNIIDQTLENEVYMEDGIIIKPEKRSTIDKFKQWYYKKFIQTGKAAKFEEFIDKKTKFSKTAIKVIGTVTTIVLLFCLQTEYLEKYVQC